jgi:hypothetical protein
LPHHQAYLFVASSTICEEANMNELYTWFSYQHHGLRTFRTFQQRLESLSTEELDHRGLYRLLSSLVGRYIEAFDEEPLPVSVGDRAYDRPVHRIDRSHRTPATKAKMAQRIVRTASEGITDLDALTSVAVDEGREPAA